MWKFARKQRVNIFIYKKVISFSAFLAYCLMILTRAERAF